MATELDRVAELIAGGADVDLRDKAGFAPLHFAAQEYAVDAARLLLDHGADPDVVNQHGQTPRGLAELIGNYDVAQYFRR